MGHFTFIAGNLALDFANTVDWHASDRPQDRIRSYSDLVQWAAEAQIIGEGDAVYLSEAQASRRQEADAALDAARDLREAIYRLAFAAIIRWPPEEDAIEVLNTASHESLARLQVISTMTGLRFRWSPDDFLARPLWPVAKAAAELLTSPEISRIKQCASEDGCGWLFLDRTKNLSRRWCDMGLCGNIAKARRHRRKRARERKRE